MTTDPTLDPQPWTAAQVSTAYNAGRYEDIAAARVAGLLDAVLNPSTEA